MFVKTYLYVYLAGEESPSVTERHSAVSVDHYLFGAKVQHSRI